MTRSKRNRNNQRSGAGNDVPAPLPPKPAPYKEPDQVFWEPVPISQSNQDARAAMIQREEAFFGPLPHPEHLAQYKAVQADYPERLLRLYERQTDMAEVQATHRQELEKKVVYG